MSDTCLQFIPEDPDWTPTPAAAEAARALLASFLPDADAVEIDFKDEIEFFAPGENWSGVACPACGADLETWWNEAMNAAHAAAFEDLSVVTPCCATGVSLNHMAYGAASGFGRFVLEAMNPGVVDTSPEQDLALAAGLGAPLRKIFVRI